MANLKRTIQRNPQHMVHKTKKNKTKAQTICDGHHYSQINTNNGKYTTNTNKWEGANYHNQDRHIHTDEI